MQDDNLYPNDGAAFMAEPEDQKQEKSVEKANLLQALPFAEEIVKHFEARIKHFDSIKAIPKEFHTQPEAFMHVVAANNHVIQTLTQEKEQIEAMLSDYLDTR